MFEFHYIKILTYSHRCFLFTFFRVDMCQLHALLIIMRSQTWLKVARKNRKFNPLFIIFFIDIKNNIWFTINANQSLFFFNIHSTFIFFYSLIYYLCIFIIFYCMRANWILMNFEFILDWDIKLAYNLLFFLL